MRSIYKLGFGSIVVQLLYFLSLPVLAQSANSGLIATGAVVTRIPGEFVFLEGPVADSQGNLLFTDINNNRIHKLTNSGELSVFREPSNFANGLIMDELGNVYLTWVGGVSVRNPQGQQIEFIVTEQMPANVGFAGADSKTLFITARTGLYSLRMNVKASR